MLYKGFLIDKSEAVFLLFDHIFRHLRLNYSSVSALMPHVVKENELSR